MVVVTEVVEIDEEELNKLRDDQRFLNALHAAGVDSWEGYEAAQDLLMEQP